MSLSTFQPRAAIFRWLLCGFKSMPLHLINLSLNGIFQFKPFNSMCIVRMSKKLKSGEKWEHLNKFFAYHVSNISRLPFFFLDAKMSSRCLMISINFDKGEILCEFEICLRWIRKCLINSQPDFYFIKTRLLQFRKFAVRNVSNDSKKNKNAIELVNIVEGNKVVKTLISRVCNLINLKENKKRK